VFDYIWFIFIIPVLLFSTKIIHVYFGQSVASPMATVCTDYHSQVLIVIRTQYIQYLCFAFTRPWNICLLDILFYENEAPVSTHSHTWHNLLLLVYFEMVTGFSALFITDEQFCFSETRNFTGNLVTVIDFVHTDTCHLCRMYLSNKLPDCLISI